MAPSTHLQRKLAQLGMKYDTQLDINKERAKHTFRLYLPQPPYGDVVFDAHRVGEGYNFAGRLLGPGAATLKGMVEQSGCGMEVHDSHGLLKGRHPNPLDPELHVFCFADSQSKLDKAAVLVQKEIAPRNARFKPLAVRSGGKAVLEVDRAPVAPAPALVFVPAAQQLQALPKALAPSTAAPAQELYPDGEYKAAPSTHPKLVRHVNCYRACEFRLYFPRPPYDGLNFKAHRAGIGRGGFNFAGLVIGPAGTTLQHIQGTSGAGMEVHDKHGHLHGRKPDWLDPELHAYLYADSQAKVEKAVLMVMELLQPTNARFLPVTVTHGASALCEVVPPTQQGYRQQPQQQPQSSHYSSCQAGGDVGGSGAATYTSSSTSSGSAGGGAADSTPVTPDQGWGHPGATPAPATTVQQPGAQSAQPHAGGSSFLSGIPVPMPTVPTPTPAAVKPLHALFANLDGFAPPAAPAAAAPAQPPTAAPALSLFGNLEGFAPTGAPSIAAPANSSTYGAAAAPAGVVAPSFSTPLFVHSTPSSMQPLGEHQWSGAHGGGSAADLEAEGSDADEADGVAELMQLLMT